MYSDADVAALYDELNTWDASDDFHLSHVLAAPSVLDVGCGTGVILTAARERGHGGRLCGVDPDLAALDRARARRTDVEWVPGVAAGLAYEGEFAHAFMSANAFMCFVTDDDLRASLAAIRVALVDGGTFAFGTRDVGYREWETWTPANADEVTDHRGRALRVHHEVLAVDDGVVDVTETTSEAGEVLRVDRARLRFHAPDTLDAFLAGARFQVVERFGGFRGEP